MLQEYSYTCNKKTTLLGIPSENMFLDKSAGVSDEERYNGAIYLLHFVYNGDTNIEYIFSLGRLLIFLLHKYHYTNVKGNIKWKNIPKIPH